MVEVHINYICFFSACMQKLVEGNINDPSTDNSQISPNDVTGRCYEGKEKPGRVSHMGFAKNPLVVSLLKKIYVCS